MKEVVETKSMKKEYFRSLFLILVTTTLLIAIVFSATSSWFLQSPDYVHTFDIKAGGVLYLYVPAPIQNTNKTLIPAVAKQGAVNAGKYMNVLQEYNSADGENASWVESVANKVGYSIDFMFINEETVRIPIVDEFGELVLDSQGNMTYEYMEDEEGNPLKDDMGRIIYKTEPVPASISYTLNIKTSPYIESGQYIDIDEIVVDEFYFSYDEEPIAEGLPITEENGALPVMDINGSKTFGAVSVKGTSKIFIHFNIYLANVSELMDPMLLRNSIYLEIALAIYLPEGDNHD